MQYLDIHKYEIDYLEAFGSLPHGFYAIYESTTGKYVGDVYCGYEGHEVGMWLPPKEGEQAITLDTIIKFKHALKYQEWSE